MSVAMRRAHTLEYCLCAREAKDVAPCYESSGGFYLNDALNRWKGVLRSQTTQRLESVDQSVPKMNETGQFPKFTSIKAQRCFWDTHNAIEVLSEHSWKISKAGATSVKSAYIAKVGAKGAFIRVPREWLASIGARKGRKIKAHVRGKRLVMELA
jgi:hypothetical protein